MVWLMFCTLRILAFWELFQPVSWEQPLHCACMEPFLAPFMPVECYSGWLQDGSFGGPSAEGVAKFDGDKQICTWRKYLGGNQYGNAFPTFLGEWLGLGSVLWIWCNRPGRLLEGISAKLGDEQTRRLIMEYRAKQARIDMKKWSNAFKKLLNDNLGSSIGPEWTPYWINWILGKQLHTQKPPMMAVGYLLRSKIHCGVDGS